jgi:hypothetical protein
MPSQPPRQRIRHGVGKELTVHTHLRGVQGSKKHDRKRVRSASVTGVTAQRARGGLAADKPYIPIRGIPSQRRNPVLCHDLSVLERQAKMTATNWIELAVVVIIFVIAVRFFMKRA